jgi:membrane fusion protein (multidrug efflux system)
MNTATLTTAPFQNGRAENPVVPAPALNGANHAPRPVLDDVPPVAKPSRPPQRKRLVLGAVVVVALLAGIGVGRYWWTTGRFIESTDDSYVGGDVTVIAPKVAGFVQQLSVTDNQFVHAGDLLIKLDDRDYRAALAQAEGAVALQHATLTNLEATRHLQEAIVTQAQAEISATDAEIVRTHDDQARYQQLRETGAVSAQDFQKADTLYKQALAAGEKSHAALAAAQRQLDVIATQKQQVQAALQEAEAGRDLAQLNLSYTELRAPIDGTIGNRSAQTGAYATTGSQLISLVPAHGLWIDANFKESQLPLIHAGAPATVRVDSLPGIIFHGHVLSVAPATGSQFSVLPAENATGNFTKIVQRVTVRIVLDDEAAAAGQLRPGLSVTTRVDGRNSNGI